MSNIVANLAWSSSVRAAGTIRRKRAITIGMAVAYLAGFLLMYSRGDYSWSCVQLTLMGLNIMAAIV